MQLQVVTPCILQARSPVFTALPTAAKAIILLIFSQEAVAKSEVNYSCLYGQFVRWERLKYSLLTRKDRPIVILRDRLVESWWKPKKMYTRSRQCILYLENVY